MKFLRDYFILVGGALFVWGACFYWLGLYVASLLSVDMNTLNTPALIISSITGFLSLVFGWLIYWLISTDNPQGKE